MEGLGRILLHLNALYSQRSFLSVPIEVIEDASLHDGMILLRDLITLRQVCVEVVFSVKLDGLSHFTV